MKCSKRAEGGGMLATSPRESRRGGSKRVVTVLKELS